MPESGETKPHHVEVSLVLTQQLIEESKARHKSIVRESKRPTMRAGAPGEPNLQSFDMIDEPTVPATLTGMRDVDAVLGHTQQASAPSELRSRYGERYEDLGALGSGGMGSVRRVRDRLLNRTLAMKILHTHLMSQDWSVLRFVQEAQVGAQLQHPNILPVYDLGVLEDGHIYFTMAEIVGDSLTTHIHRVHRAIESGRWNDAPGAWNLHRLVSVFHDVCKAISYAHEHGVVHRDIKPDNVMIGPFGEVLVVDWGLAKVISGPDTIDPVVTMRSSGNAQDTQAGTVTGTPAYMSPEQATGHGHRADRRSDVYGLGVMLYEILAGRPAYEGMDTYQVLGRVLRGAHSRLSVPPRVQDDLPIDVTATLAPKRPAKGAPIPPILVEICERAMAFDAGDRYQSASKLVEVVGQWLDGSRRRESALELVTVARDMDTDIAESRREADRLDREADVEAGLIKSWEPEEKKIGFWRLQDRARRLRLEGLIRRTEQTQLLRAALAHKEDLVEAHEELANRYRVLHAAAEMAGDADQVQQLAVIMREHTRALPEENPTRVELMHYFRGDGSLSLETSPAGATATLVEYKLKGRRLIANRETPIGTTPIREYPLKMGTFAVRLELPGHHPTTYPVFNRRLSVHSTETPEGTLGAIPLLPQSTLGEQDCYVPAGWCDLGGDMGTPNSLPAMRVWVDGFVIRRFPVTHAEYLEFLNDLASSGRREEALIHVPREQSSDSGEAGVMVYRFAAEAPAGAGRFSLPDDPHRAHAWPEQPVTMIQWSSARAYASWLAERTGKPWRLPMEFEWEKAARGVDGRSYPWGDTHDPSWSCMKDSHEGEVRIQNVESFPVDESIYGVRGTAGNTRDWCLDKFREEGPPLQQGRLVLPTEEDLADEGFKSTRGGSYGNSASRARSADRDWWFPNRSYVGRGVRVAWGLADWELGSK